MSELKLYEISEEYISYISTVEKNVFSSKENDRNHTRKYLGIVYSINGYNYYIPLSSPKNSDYRMENGVQKIRGSIVPIIRITSQSSSGELELKGTLKLSNMIPVPASELTLYDVEHEQDLFYKALIHKEMLFIRKNKNKIVQNAKILYKQKKENNPAIGYLKSTVDFTWSTPLLEAASSSSTSRIEPFSMPRQAGHRLQGFPSWGSWQLTALERIFAQEVLPVPLVPVNR